MRLFLASLALACVLAVAAAQQNCHGVPNFLPVSTDAPVLVNKTTYGKFYQQTSVSPPLNILHLYGTPYDFGFAHGTLMREQIQTLFPEFYTYIYDQIQPYVHTLPLWLQKTIEVGGVAAALDATYELTKPFIPEYFMEEIQGLADGSGVSYQKILQVQMFPELIKAGCSMFGAWGPAISNTTGSLFQLRALDWDTSGPFQQYPVVLVYHPQDSNGHAFSTMGWAGFIGAMTGYSSAPIGLCEKVWLGYNGTSSRQGIPWHFLLRDIMQFDSDIDSAVSRIANAHRTCPIFVGLGDYSNQFRAIEYSYEIVEVYDDHNSPTWNDHPNFEGLVYIDKHVQPSSDPCMPSLLEKYYGSLNVQNTIQYIAPIFETGDMHVAVYDFANNYMYVSNASPVPASGPNDVVPAYNRNYIRLDMNQLFATTL